MEGRRQQRTITSAGEVQEPHILWGPTMTPTQVWQDMRKNWDVKETSKFRDGAVIPARGKHSQIDMAWIDGWTFYHNIEPLNATTAMDAIFAITSEGNMDLYYDPSIAAKNLTEPKYSSKLKSTAQEDWEYFFKWFYSNVVLCKAYDWALKFEILRRNLDGDPYKLAQRFSSTKEGLIMFINSVRNNYYRKGDSELKVLIDYYRNMPPLDVAKPVEMHRFLIFTVAKHIAKNVLDLTFEQFRTLLIEAMWYANNRPICSNDRESVYKVICPNFFLMKHLGNDLCPLIPIDTLPYDRLRAQEEFLDKWCEILYEQTLINVRPFQKWSTEIDNVRPGQLVVVPEDNVKRYKWKVAKIVDVNMHQDKLVREASVLIDGKTKPVWRSMRYLIPLTFFDEKNSFKSK